MPTYELANELICICSALFHCWPNGGDANGHDTGRQGKNTEAVRAGVDEPHGVWN